LSLFGDHDLPEFLTNTDILILLLPLTKTTVGILDARLLTQLPTGPRVINLGRGLLIVEDDLWAALQSAHISGAALDVFSEEPLSSSHPFWEEKNISHSTYRKSYKSKHGRSSYFSKYQKISKGKNDEWRNRYS